MRTFVWSLAVLLAFLVGPADSQEHVRIGFSDSPPISARNPATGELAGLAVSLFEEVAAQANLQTQAELMSFGALLPSLREKKVDVITMSATPERRRDAIFSAPFARYGEALLVRSDDTTPYATLAQLTGKRVASNAGGGWIAAAQSAGAEIVTFSGAEQSIQALDRGEVDAVVGNAPTYTFLLRTGRYRNVRMAGTYLPQQTNELAFALRHGDEALLGKIDAALRDLERRGVTQKLRSEWGF